MCEGAELNWDALSTLFKDEPYFDAFHTTDHHGGYRFFSSIFLKVKLVEDQRQLSSNILPTRDQSSLFDVLSRFRNLQSTDPRDKIYRLLSLVTQDHGIIVNYSKPLRDLYKEATLSIINLSKNLDIICQNPFEREGGPLVLGQDEDAAQAPQMFPSWTAEFHLGRPYCVSVLFAQRGIFKASSSELETPCRLLGPKKDVLILKGSVLGHIGPVLQGDSPNLNVQTETTEIMRMYFRQGILDDPDGHEYAPIVSGKQICPKETLIRAYWRTLVKDCTAPPRMRRLLESEIESLNPVNRDHLQAGQVLQTFQISLDESKSRSAFSYHPGKDSDFTEIEESKSLELTFLPWTSYSNRDWMFSVADNGLFLLARPGVRQGDVIAVLDGAKIPMVLRRAEANHEHQGLEEVYQVVCSTYVHGFMDGEAERGVSEGWLEEKDFLIA
ncbi:HET domain-containing protein [Fusarium sp. LHS14.1]|nr:HET domain-containing protein [Fusarium sp. LHS14.1]